MRNTYFKLYACCVAVKGAMRGTICDLQRGSFKFVPNDLITFLESTAKRSAEEIKHLYPESDSVTIDEYFSFLIENEFGFWTDHPEAFTDLNLDYYYPGLISNAIIDFNRNTHHPISSIFDQLEYLGCQSIQLRFFDVVETETLVTILDQLKGRRIQAVELLVKYRADQGEQLRDFINTYPRIITITIHSGYDNTVILRGHKEEGLVNMVKQEIDSETHCGMITPFLFSIGTESYIESVNFNSCLNKKIAVDKNGNIKNCPSIPEVFGNVNSTPLSDVINRKDFTRYFNITKNQIKECQDCEFRYICTDCRAYLKDKTDVLSKPEKCTYNPYEAVWH